jgi:hypothetical protein
MEWGGVSDIGYRFILDLPIYSSTEIVDKNVEENIKTFLKNRYPISDILSGILLNMINLLTNAQHILQSTEGKRKLRKKHAYPKCGRK